MAYVLTDGGSTVVTYPYSIGLLRRDNPNVSFPANPTNAQLAEWNVYPVVATTAPSYNVITQNLVEQNPQRVETSWRQVWSVEPATQAEIDERTASYQAAAASESARLLTESDTYVARSIADGLKLHPDFISYRSAVSDPASLTGYPVSPLWPSMPANIFDGPIDYVDSFESNLSI